MIDLKKLWEAMPRDVQRKISCHDLKRIVDNYNSRYEHADRYSVVSDLPEYSVYDHVKKRDLFPTKSGNRDHKSTRCFEEDAQMIAQALNRMESERTADDLSAKIHAVRLMAGHNAFTIEGAGWLAEICELVLAAESQRDAAGLADEKPDGQAENARDLAPPP